MSDYTHFLDMFRHNEPEAEPVPEENTAKENMVSAEAPAEIHETQEIYIESLEMPVAGSIADETPILTPEESESEFDRLVTARQEQPRKISAQPQQEEEQPENDAKPVFLDDTPSDPAAAPSGDTKPIVVKGSDKGSLLRAIAHSSENKDENAPAAEDEPVSEKDRKMEEKLRQVREKRMEDFGLPAKTPVLTDAEDNKEKVLPLPGFLRKFSAVFADKDIPFVRVKGAEYGHTQPDRRRVVALLIKKKNELLIRSGILGGLGLILLLMNIITTVSAARNNGFFMVFNADIGVYATVNLIFLLLAGAVLFSDLKNGVISLLQMRPRTEAALFGMYAASLVQTVCLYMTKLQPESSYHLFAGAAILLGGVYTASKYFWNENTLHCFRSAASSEKQTYLREVRSARVLSGILSEKQDPGVRADFCAETDRISNFLGGCADGARTAMPKVILVPILYAVALVCGIITAIAEKSPVCGVSAATAVLCFSFPVSGVLAGGFLLKNKNKKLSQENAYIRNYADAHGFMTVNHFAFDADELLNAHIVNIECTHGLNEFAAASCAYVLADAAGGCLAQAFSVVKSGRKVPRLPQPEQVSYEEKLGVSAWVDGCRVLLGTQEMMVNHNVSLPHLTEAKPEQALLLLAIEGKFAASFAIQYDFNKETADALHTIARTGINLLVRTSDPNITGHRIQSMLRLPENSVKIVANTGIDLFDSIHDRSVPEEDTGVVAQGGLNGLAKCAAQCADVDNKGRNIGLICTVGATTGAAIAGLLTLTGGMGRAAGWNAVLLQVLWCVAAVFVPGSVFLSGKNNKKPGARPAAAKKEKPSAAQTEKAKKTENKSAGIADTIASAVNDVLKTAKAVLPEKRKTEKRSSAEKKKPSAGQKKKSGLSDLVNKITEDRHDYTVASPDATPEMQAPTDYTDETEIGNPDEYAEQLNFVLNADN